MKLKIISTYLFFSLLIFTAGAMITHYPPVKIICLYRMTSRMDSTSKVTRQEFVQLAISDSLSEFRSFDRYKGDSLLIKYAHVSLNSPAFNEGMNAVTNIPKYNFKGVIIKDLKANKCFYYGMINKVLYYYEDGDYRMKWQLSSENAFINGYKCQKAFTQFEGRKYTAWFTRQIPISNGPYKFGGLPGLIVSIKDETNSYKFELTRIYQHDLGYKINIPDKVIYYKQPGKLIDKAEYYRIFYDFEENYVDKFLGDGITKVNDEDGFRNSYREKIKHRNNPIELDYKKH